MSDDTFLTTDEVMDYLQINLRTVYRLIKAGRLPAVRVGRQWRFERTAIEAWLEAHRRANGLAIPVRDRPARALIVDDEQSVRDVLVATLSSAGYTAASAPDGTRALDMLAAEAYDLLIADVWMPGIDGLSLVRAARRQSSTIAVVIITGASSETVAIEAINLSVNGYLIKPFRPDRIVAVADRALGVTSTISPATS
ncbi:MAG: hypothetical protein ABS36_08965 [Acidobacteria bacterium SCN 69-37]|nr:MAG: hypothetical protein ABS36_08965 [Acidobacteria bacterium SCN 69-37]